MPFAKPLTPAKIVELRVNFFVNDKPPPFYIGERVDIKNSINDADICIPKMDIVFHCLKKIPPYTSLNNVYLEKVEEASLIPLARYVVKTRLTFCVNLASAMEKAGIELYRPIFLRQAVDQWRLIMPPVVEKHNNTWVIIDGLHRFWHARQTGITHPWALCIDPPPLPLASTPRHWDQVIVTETQPSLTENLLDVDQSLVRPLSIMFKSSLFLYNQIDAKM